MTDNSSSRFNFPNENYTACYRAMLCVSVVFAVARCPPICPIRLSVTFVHSVHLAEDIVKLCQPGSPVILVFWPQCKYPIPRGTLQRVHGLENFAIFVWNRCISGKQYKIGPWLQWNVNHHRWWIDQCRFWWPWVTRNLGFKVTV